jgi:hypothetical protein
LHTLISCLGERAGMGFSIHPHMLRHSCGYALVVAALVGIATSHDQASAFLAKGPARCAVFAAP